MITLAMFPGQGSQYVGMGKLLLEQFPYVSEVFEEAEDACKVNLRSLCFDGPESELKLTANTQPCILTCSVVVWRVLQEESGFKPTHFAGHSLGEYSALVASGLLELGKAAALVRRRGEAMQKAVPAGVGAMAAVMQLSADELEKLCVECSASDSKVEVANYNSPQQIVVAGHKAAVERLVEKVTELKKRSVILPVSAPFHSSLMAPARDEMTPLLEDTPLQKTDSKIYTNLTGKIEDYKVDYLIQQIDHPVRWTQTIESAMAENTERYVEVGPGKVLWGLTRRIIPRKSAELLATEGDDLLTTIKALS